MSMENKHLKEFESLAEEVKALEEELNGYKEICEELIGGADDDGVFDVCISRVNYGLLCEHHLKVKDQSC